MRKVFTILMMAVFAISSFAATSPSKSLPKATEILIPIGKTGTSISLYDLAHISVKDYEKVSGKQLRFAQRIGFKIAQRDLRKNIAEDGTLNSKRVARSLARIKAGETGFHIGGFALGFFIGLIGVVIAYVINDDYKRNRVKWAWVGFGIFLALYIALALL